MEIEFADNFQNVEIQEMIAKLKLQVSQLYDKAINAIMDLNKVLKIRRLNLPKSTKGT